MAERKIDPKFNIHSKYRKMHIMNPYRGAPYEIEITNAIARANLEGFTIPDAATLNALDGLIKRTKLNGNYWSSRDVFSMFQFNNTLYGDWTKINLKDASKPLMTWHGGVSYEFLGIKYNGSNSYINTNYNPSTSGNNININSIGISHGFENDNIPSGTDFCGIQQSVPNRRLAILPYVKLTSTPGYVAFANDFNNLVFSDTLSFGGKRLMSYGRSFTTRYVYVNDYISTQIESAVSPLVNINYYLGATNVNGTANQFINKTESLFSCGGSITEAEAIQFKNDLNIYFSEIGTEQIS